MRGGRWNPSMSSADGGSGGGAEGGPGKPRHTAGAISRCSAPILQDASRASISAKHNMTHEPQLLLPWRQNMEVKDNICLDCTDRGNLCDWLSVTEMHPGSSWFRSLHIRSLLRLHVVGPLLVRGSGSGVIMGLRQIIN